MATFSNTIVYAEDWATRLQARLNQPALWKEICRVEYTNARVLNNPYLSDPTVQSHTRGTSYTYQGATETNESVTYSTGKILPMIIDRGDLAQSGYLRQMELADLQGQLIDEAITAAVLQSNTQFQYEDGATLIGGASGSITVSATNVDDIVRGIVKIIRQANGQGVLDSNGGFAVWKPSDFEKLEAYLMANGFNVADQTIRDGGFQGVKFGGLEHYSSNQLLNGRMVAGVKKVLHLGICKDLYGQIMVNDKDPSQFSAVSVVSRVDFGVKLWHNVGSLVLDIAVV